jgi:hypothetical protein
MNALRVQMQLMRKELVPIQEDFKLPPFLWIFPDPPYEPLPYDPQRLADKIQSTWGQLCEFLSIRPHEEEFYLDQIRYKFGLSPDRMAERPFEQKLFSDHLAQTLRRYKAVAEVQLDQ